MYQTILYKVEKRRAWITLNRPEKRNALNGLMIEELTEVLRLSAKDDKVKVIALKANGPAFSAGADLAYLQQMQDNTYKENLADSRALMQLLKCIYQHPKLVIAMLEGHAIAGGCGLATVCDYSFAVPAAKLGYSETRIGFIPAIVMTFLVRKIGEGYARDLLLSARLIDAEEALKKGLINAVFEADEILHKANAFMDDIIENNSAESIKRTKQLLVDVQNLSFNEALSLASEQNAAMRSTADCHKGIDAFLKKEKPTW